MMVFNALETMSDVKASVFIAGDAYWIPNTLMKDECIEFGMPLSTSSWAVTQPYGAYVCMLDSGGGGSPTKIVETMCDKKI